MKKVLLLCMCAIAVLFASHVHAQEEQEGVIVSSPDVLVDSLSIDDTSVSAGERVDGSFIIENLQESSLPEVYYRIYLTGEHDAEGNPQVIYGSTNSGPVHMNAEEPIYIPFSIIVPEGIAGPIGVRVQSYLRDETPLGWAEELIEVAGTSSGMTIESGAIIANGVEYDLQEGPSFDAQEVVPVRITIQSGADDSVSVFPRLSLYNKNDVFLEIGSQSLEAFAVAPGAQEYTVSVKAPSEPGTYVGYIDFESETGAVMLPSIGVRFVVRGDTATIGVVRTNVETVEKGQLFSLFVGYAGAPIDLTRGQVQSIDDAAIMVDVYNENNEKVASAKQSVDLNVPGEAMFALEADRDAQALRAEVTITGNGKVLAYSYNQLTEVPVQYDASSQALDAEEMIKIALIAVIILILIVITYGLIAMRRTRTTTIALLIIVAGSVAAYAILEGKETEAQGFFPAPTISVSVSPAKPAPGAKVTIKGSATVAICLNRGAQTSGSVSFNGKNIKSFNGYIAETGSKNIVPFKTAFNVVTTVPAKAGKYKGVVNAKVTYTNKGSFEAITSGSKTYSVKVVDPTEQPDKCPNINGVQTVIPVNMQSDSSGNCVPEDSDTPSGGDNPDGGNPNGGGPNGNPNSCTEDVWQCNAWGSCVNGVQSRACTMVYDCPNVQTPSPATSQSCTDGVVPACTYPAADGSCPPPDITFSISPKLISKGGSCKLAWQVEGAESCEINGVSVSSSGGTQSESPLETTVYRISCSNGPSVASKFELCSVQDVSEE